MNTPEYCFLAINRWPLCMDKGQWASWVQAVFSVVAIAAAIWIGHRTDAKARQGARNHFLMFKSGTKSAIRYSMNAAQEQNYFNYGLGRAMILDAMQLGQTVPIHLLTRHNAFITARFRSVLSTAAATMERDPRAPEWVSIEFKHTALALSELMEDLLRFEELKTTPALEDWK